MKTARTNRPAPAGGNFATPLRYPGGKGRLGPWLARLMRHNRISGGWYVEPYAGGAGAAIYLLSSGYVDHIAINDLDPVVHAFWWAVLNDAAGLLRLIDETPVTIASWERQKAVLATPGSFSPTEVGFATFFLNRTNRSGILKGGVIGGRQQNGPYPIDARFNKENLSARIRLIASLKRHISLYQEDALDLLEGMRTDLPAKSLTYLDPPYYQKGSQLYRNHYKPEDHVRIAAAVSEIRSPWLVTYDDCPEIRLLYHDCDGVDFSLYYSTAGARPLATELMYYGNLEMLPEGPTMTRRNV